MEGAAPKLCARCGGSSANDARFCMQCGTAFGQSCVACGVELPSEARFCPRCAQPTDAGVADRDSRRLREPRTYTPRHLAERILRSRSALEGERKLVTVLFADLKGSLELSQQVGPEEWHQILDRFFQILSEGVHRFEGTVNQYTGDGIMALFGAPLSHEDHAQRACYAALRLHAGLKSYADELRLSRGLDFVFRIGLNTGEVVVGKIGDDLRMDYTAQGVVVGLAQRVEQLAAANSIYLTGVVARLVSGYFGLRDLGLASVKGLRDPFQVYELTGLGKQRTRLEVARSRGLSRFVGRDADLAALEAALDEARAGRGQVVGVVAEAGTGKSRLCLEFVERCRARGIRVDEGHCLAHGRMLPYQPVLELLRAIFDIGERDSDLEARRKIAGELVLLDPGLSELLPLVFDFLGVADPEHPAPELSPEARQRLLAAFMRHLTRARSAREPQVFLIDDAHWIDAGSDAFLAHAVESASGTRTLWLINFRPEYHAEWMTGSHYRQLPLLPLGRDAIAALLADLLGSDGSLAGLSARIYERTGGNPFFVEELAQSLVESGRLEGTKGAYRLVAPADELELPGTVQAVLAARIDRLREPEKRLLQTAAVIGRQLHAAVLERVSESPEAELSSALAHLVQGGFLFEQALYPEVEYAFKHPLTHAVAYESQLAQRRAGTHASVARALEELEADRLDEKAALLAHHWEAAGDAATAARWHARAARWCAADNMADALRHWTSVRELLRGSDSTPDTVALQLESAMQTLGCGWRMGFGREDAKAILAEGRALAARGGDLRAEALLLAEFTSVFVTSGDLLEVRGEIDEAFALAERVGDPALRYAVCEPRIDMLFFSGRIRAAAELCEHAIELGEAMPPGALVRSGVPVAWTLGYRGWILTLLGRLGDAAASLRRCEEAAAGLRHTELNIWLETLGALHRVCDGDAGGALPHARRAVELAEKLGSNLTRVWAHHHLGVALTLGGNEPALAVERLEFALATARETRSWLTDEASILAHLAEAELASGDAERAQRTAREAIEIARRRKTPVWEVQAHLALARILLAGRGASAREEIELSLATSLSLVEQTEAYLYAPDAHELRAEQARLLGDRSGQERALREAQRRLLAIGAPRRADRIAAALRSL